MQQQNMFELLEDTIPKIISFSDLLDFISAQTAWSEDEKIMSDIKITRAFISQNSSSTKTETLSVSEIEEGTGIDNGKETGDEPADFQAVCSMNLTGKGKSASIFFFGKKALEASCRKDDHIVVDIPVMDFPQEPKWVSACKIKKNTVSFDLREVANWDQFGNYLRYLKDIKFRLLTPDSIGCCNEYLTCSNKGECIKSHWLLSIKCLYRTNLENGRVFFGEQKNA